MSSIARAAAQDYNQTIAGIKEAAHENVIDTIVNVVECGIRAPNGSQVNRAIINSDVRTLQPLGLNEYKTPGGTPLWDSVGDLIEQLQAVPDYSNPEVTFIVMAITDGEEAHSSKWNAQKLSAKIKELQATDRWTFVFRVPRGYGSAIARKLNLNEGNILEWETSTKGMEASTAATAQALTSFYQGRTRGIRSTTTFYANDLSKVSASEIKANLVDISGEVQFLPVSSFDSGEEIAPFIQMKLGRPLAKGQAFYQLTKTEKEVQDYKIITIRDRSTRAVYSGHAARQVLGLPKFGSVRLVPGNTGNYDVFIQSTSTNRKLAAGTEVLFWPNPRA